VASCNKGGVSSISGGRDQLAGSRKCPAKKLCGGGFVIARLYIRVPQAAGQI
jgi:hypothetical protein